MPLCGNANTRCSPPACTHSICPPRAGRSQPPNPSCPPPPRPPHAPTSTILPSAGTQQCGREHVPSHTRTSSLHPVSRCPRQDASLAEDRAGQQTQEQREQQPQKQQPDATDELQLHLAKLALLVEVRQRQILEREEEVEKAKVVGGRSGARGGGKGGRREEGGRCALDLRKREGWSCDWQAHAAAPRQLRGHSASVRRAKQAGLGGRGPGWGGRGAQRLRAPAPAPRHTAAARPPTRACHP